MNFKEYSINQNIKNNEIDSFLLSIIVEFYKLSDNNINENNDITDSCRYTGALKGFSDNWVNTKINTESKLDDILSRIDKIHLKSNPFNNYIECKLAIVKAYYKNKKIPDLSTILKQIEFALKIYTKKLNEQTYILSTDINNMLIETILNKRLFNKELKLNDLFIVESFSQEHTKEIIDTKEELYQLGTKIVQLRGLRRELDGTISDKDQKKLINLITKYTTIYDTFKKVFDIF